MYKYLKDIFVIGKSMKNGTVNSHKLINWLQDMFRDKPCFIVRLLIEKILFQDHQIPEEDVNPRDFFFYGLKL